jgi:Hsp20/alpha crystallin family
MSTMLRWSPTREFHFHHDADDLFLRFFEGVTTNETVQRPASWLPVSLMDNVLTVKGERKPGPDTMDKEYFVREVAYGGFERSFALPEGVDAAQIEAKYANGMLEVRIPPISTRTRPVLAAPRPHRVGTSCRRAIHSRWFVNCAT